MFKFPWKSKKDPTSQQQSSTPSVDTTPEEKYKKDFERLNVAQEEKRKHRKESAGILKTIRREIPSDLESHPQSSIGNPFRDQSTEPLPEGNP